MQGLGFRDWGLGIIQGIYAVMQRYVGVIQVCYTGYCETNVFCIVV